MYIKTSFFRRAFGAVLLGVLSTCAVAEELPDDPAKSRFTLVFKTGYLNLNNTDQRLSGDDQRFDKKTNGIFAVEGEWRSNNNPNLAYGFDVMHYRGYFHRVSNNESEFVDTFSGLAKAKYFLTSGDFQPYVGGGLGIGVGQDYTGPIHGTATGIVGQGVIGAQWRINRVGLRLEYTYMSARLEDHKSESDTYDGSNRGFLLGISVALGR